MTPTVRNGLVQAHNTGGAGDVSVRALQLKQAAICRGSRAPTVLYETNTKEKTMVSNLTAVQAFEAREAIAEELVTVLEHIKTLRESVESLQKLNEAASRTTEVYEGVALHIDGENVYATSYDVGRSALAYEHVQKPGVFLVRVSVRHNGDRLLDTSFTSREDALKAAKSFVAGVKP
jgi:hypothetical protein